MSVRESNIPIPILAGNETPRMRVLVDAERTMEFYRELARAAIDWVLADRKADDAQAKLAAGYTVVEVGAALRAEAHETSMREERLHEAFLEKAKQLVERLER